MKRFTLLCYISPEDRPDLGTDLYRDADTWAQRISFRPGTGVVFIPSDKTWHGFEPRALGAVGKSLIVSFVTAEWRAKEQLAFGEPVAGR